MSEFHVGQHVWGADWLSGEVVEGDIVYLIPSDFYSTGQADINVNDTIYTLPFNVIYDHKPNKVTKEDEYGRFTIWE